MELNFFFNFCSRKFPFFFSRNLWFFVGDWNGLNLFQILIFLIKNIFFFIHRNFLEILQKSGKKKFSRKILKKKLNEKIPKNFSFKNYLSKYIFYAFLSITKFKLRKKNQTNFEKFQKELTPLQVKKHRIFFETL